MRRTFALLLLLLPALTAFAAKPAALRDITVQPEEEYALVTFLVGSRVEKVVLESRTKGRAQIRMKSMTATSAALASARLKPGMSAVKAHIERTDVLITNITFTREVLSMRITERNAKRVVIRVALGRKLTSAGTQAGSTGTDGTTTGTRNSAGRRRWSLSTIVIDAGHGGKDPGAIGLNDVREKDVTLAVAKKLRDEIKARMPGVKVVMTRSNDSFVELYRRGQIANERAGRLFISIHCNSAPHKPETVRGFECYILRPGKIEDAASVAAAENAAIRFESDRGKYTATDENTIMASMAQNAFARYSEQLADAIRLSMRTRTSLPDRGVHQAGFYVLIGASMPSVLVELGYLTNEDDVKVLASTGGQRKIARALFEGIKAYEKVYSASLN